jgi:hypothetical protein
MTPKGRRRIAVPIVLLAIVIVCRFTVDSFRDWAYFGLRAAYLSVHPVPARCKQRAAELTARVDLVKQDAKNLLKVGTKKDGIVSFFASEKIPFTFDQIAGKREARGTIYFKGLQECENIACGDDSALIGVQVEVDTDGTVLSDPVIVGMYTDCL